MPVALCLDASKDIPLFASASPLSSPLLSSTPATSFIFTLFSFFTMQSCRPAGLCTPTRLSPIVVLLFSLSTPPHLHIHPGAALTRLSTTLHTERAPIARIAQMRMIWISSGSRNGSSYYQGSVSRFFSTTPHPHIPSCYRLWKRFQPTLLFPSAGVILYGVLVTRKT